MKKRIGVLAVLGFMLIFSVRIYSSDAQGKLEKSQRIVERPHCIDIGIEVSLGDAIITLAVEPRGTITSPLTVKIGGVTYGVCLADPSEPDASPFQLETRSGVKALKIAETFRRPQPPVVPTVSLAEACVAIGGQCAESEYCIGDSNTGACCWHPGECIIHTDWCERQSDGAYHWRPKGKMEVERCW